MHDNNKRIPYQHDKVGCDLGVLFFKTSKNCVYYCKIKLFVKISAEQFQRSNPLSAPRLEMNVGLGNTSYINIHKLKREVDSLKQRQQEIQLFNQVQC